MFIRLGLMDWAQRKVRSRSAAYRTFSGDSTRTIIRPLCRSADTTRPPGSSTGRRSRRSVEWRWTFFLGRSALCFGLSATLSPFTVAFSVIGRGTDGLYVGSGWGGWETMRAIRQEVPMRLAESGLDFARHRSAYPKAAERVAQKKTGALRSRSINCECAQLLPGDWDGCPSVVVSIYVHYSMAPLFWSRFVCG